jgi:hypothetical protein
VSPSLPLSLPPEEAHGQTGGDSVALLSKLLPRAQAWPDLFISLGTLSSGNEVRWVLDEKLWRNCPAYQRHSISAILYVFLSRCPQ